MYIKKSDFNDEFMDLYEEFSPSWRKEADEMNSSNIIIIVGVGRK